MTKNKRIYEHNTLEFLTVALEYCAFVEKAKEVTLFDFSDKSTKILSLLYLKATLLPNVERQSYREMEHPVSEQMYETIRTGIATLLGEHDAFLETFHPDMQYSDTPIAAFISEYLADVYQDMGNFVNLYRERNEQVMEEALAICQQNFKDFWGQRLLNALKALHTVRYSAKLSPNINEEDQEDQEDQEQKPE